MISKCYIDVIRPLELSSTVFSLGDANLHTSSKVVTFLCPYMVILQTVNVRVTKCIIDVYEISYWDHFQQVNFYDTSSGA